MVLFWCGLLVFFCLRVGDNLSACPLWACVVFSTSPPPRQEWSHSFLGLYVSLSCGFSQLRLFEKLYFLKPRVFFLPSNEAKGTLEHVSARSCWPWLGKRWASKGAAAGAAVWFAARCTDSYKGKERSTETRRSTGKILCCPGKKAYS